MTCAMKGTRLCGLSKWGSGVSPVCFVSFAQAKEKPPRLVNVEYDKLINTQLERASVTSIYGFSKIFPDAVKVLTRG